MGPMRPTGVGLFFALMYTSGMAAVVCGPGLECLTSRVDNSLLHDLSPDPRQRMNTPNKQAREVRSGHYVQVLPTPLPDPEIVACSAPMLHRLGLDEDICTTSPFIKAFSGHTTHVAAFQNSWATPYALSIYGEAVYPPGAGPRSDGYGDGRAVSLAEVVTDTGERWELQLKGGGATPFRRGGDGRAVLRSSVREFLASEAMYHLNVSTTRALSLVVSREERVMRPWYSGHDQGERHGGDVMQSEPCAITTRVSRSFIRVGTFELFSRRAARGSSQALAELRALAQHTIRRDFQPHVQQDAPFSAQLLGMARASAQAFVRMAADWLRVGYAQSNFNSDNCLVSGATVDYGPFGYMERWRSDWGMWIGSGHHFSFMNQPNAAIRNFRQFAHSLVPLLDAQGAAQVRAIATEMEDQMPRAVQTMWASKLGLRSGAASAGLMRSLEALVAQSEVDYTLFWRQLCEVALRKPSQGKDDVLGLLEEVFYEGPSPALRLRWEEWVHRWLDELLQEGRDPDAVSKEMKSLSPKYVPREWMLVQAYKSAEQGNYDMVHTLLKLFQKPYEEQPQYEALFYRRAPDGASEQGGVGFMS